MSARHWATSFPSILEVLFYFLAKNNSASPPSYPVSSAPGKRGFSWARLSTHPPCRSPASIRSGFWNRLLQRPLWMDGIDSLMREKIKTISQILINRRCYCIGSLAEIARLLSTSALNNSRSFANSGIASLFHFVYAGATLIGHRRLVDSTELSRRSD